MTDKSTTDQHDMPSVVLFDGVCNLCIGSVQFIIKRDSTRMFHFAALQSDTAKQLLSTFEVEPDGLNSFYLVRQGICFERSDAALEVVKYLDGYWWLLGCLRWIPRKLRDAVYNAIGRQRYRLFGKREVCLVPSQDVLDRFIGDKSEIENA